MTYFSVFGKIRFRRHYFHAPGQEGFCPLDAELSLPPRFYSDLLRDWAEYGITSESYDQSIKVLQRILGLSVSKLAMEMGVQEDAADVDAFYEQKAVPPAEAEGDILVIQADGKGVPMVRNDLAPQTVRRGKGDKRTQKKEALVTAIYTVAPYDRTLQEVAGALLRHPAKDEEAQSTADSRTKRPLLGGKEVRATLDGKDVAFVVNFGSNWYSDYFSAEATAIEDFVEDGGGLIVMGDNSYCPNANINPVAQRFGTTAAPSQTVGRDSAGYAAVNVAISGSGRVIALGDVNLWVQYYTYGDGKDVTRGGTAAADTFSLVDNRPFARNAFDWATLLSTAP
jgi:hypothetical protein